MNYIRREVIRAVIYFSIVLLGIIAVLLFLRFSISGVVLRIESLRNQLAVREVNARSLVSLHDEYDSTIQNYEAILKNYVPRRDDLVNVSRDVQNIAVRNGVNAIVSLVSETPANPPIFGFVVFSISARGASESVKRFFTDLNQFRFLTARDGGFVFIERESGVEASTKLRVYYQSL